MHVLFSKRFEKEYKKLTKSLRQKVEGRLRMLAQNERTSILRVHTLHGEYKGYKSIDITGDLRVVYKREGISLYVHAVGTHSQLYE